MSHKLSYNGVPAVEMKQFLEEKYLQFNTPSFIEKDPVSIPHTYSDLHDIEVSGFLTATIAWGRRDLILRSSSRMMKIMGNSPYDFVMEADEKQMEALNGFVHRTFNGVDFTNFIKGLRFIYSENDTLESVIVSGMKGTNSLKNGLSHFRSVFFSIPHEQRTEKHFADPFSGAAAKRLNMFLRWMVRDDKKRCGFWPLEEDKPITTILSLLIFIPGILPGNLDF